MIVTYRGVLILAALLLAGCGAPPDVGPTTRNQPTEDTRPAEQRFAEMMLADIAASEQKLGRSLAPARIVRITRLRAGERYELRRLDGSDAGAGAMGPGFDEAGWLVEAVGTFIDDYSNPGQIDGLGTHGFHLWEDTGEESFGFIPCWRRQPVSPDFLEGRCDGVA